MRQTWTVFFLMACVFAVLTCAAQPPTPAAAPPNIVLILADDFSINLIPRMLTAPSGGLAGLTKDGATFNNFYVGDSLCCPSRSTIFTGKYPHNSGVFGNTWAPDKNITDGGFGAFMNNNDQASTFALALKGAKPAYTTAMMGKYLNGYLPYDNGEFKGTPYNSTSVIRTQWGWDEWHVAGNGYPEFSYDTYDFRFSDPSGGQNHHSINPGDYMTTVLSNAALIFVKNAHEPFFLEVATFAPHGPIVLPTAMRPRFPARSFRKLSRTPRVRTRIHPTG